MGAMPHHDHPSTQNKVQQNHRNTHLAIRRSHLPHLSVILHPFQTPSLTHPRMRVPIDLQMQRNSQLRQSITCLPKIRN